MAKKTKVEIQVNSKGGPSLKKTTAEVNKQKRAVDKLNKSEKKRTKSAYGGQAAQKQGIIQTANSTKNFSKMSRAVDGGGGGTGGLVRAYALLAANVFALSAAFGILSRAAQVDTLTASMEQLEVVSGKAILQVSRDLQEAAGFGMDFAESMRATSLAMSAGFGGEQITQLAEVARNAAVSLGRNVPDALDRIFRGVIKVEPELLDEIGLFVRVKEASAKYAAQIGKSASDLTEFEKRQAFLNEALEQGTTKFAAFEDIETDAFTLLATTFSDMTQGIMSFLNKGILPLIKYLTDNKMLLGTLFAIVAYSLIKLAVPAMGAFTNSIAANAGASQKAHADYLAKIKNRVALSQDEHTKWVNIQVDKKKWLAWMKAEESKAGPQASLGVRGKKESKELEATLKKSIGTGKGQITLEKRRAAVKQRILDLEKKVGFEKRMQKAEARTELTNLKAEQAVTTEIVALEKSRTLASVAIVKGKVAEMTAAKLAKNEILSMGLATVAGAAEMGGYSAAIRIAKQELVNMAWAAWMAGGTLSNVDKALFMTKAHLTAAGVAAQGFWMKLMGPFSVFLMLMPALLQLNKWMGIGSEEAEKLSKANTASAEALDKLGRRIERAEKQMLKLTDAELDAGQAAEAYNRGQEAFAQGILTTVEALDVQEKAFEEYKLQATAWAFFWGETFPSLWGGGTENAVNRTKEAILKGIENTDADVSPALEKLGRKIMALRAGVEGDTIMANAGGFGAKAAKKRNEDRLVMLEKLEEAYIDLARAETKGFVNMRSAIDGATESAKEFTDSLIITTDVDKPLASFRQITSNFQEINDKGEKNLMTDKSRAVYAQEIADSTAFKALMTEEESKALLASVKNLKQFEVELKKITNRYLQQQTLLVLSATTLEQITSTQKNISKLTKESTTAIKLKYELERKTAALNIDIAKIATRNTRTQTNITEARIAQLSASEDIMSILTEEEKTEENIVLIQAAINAYRKEEILLTNERWAESTRDLKAQKEGLEIQLKRLALVEKLNQATLKGAQIQQKVAAFVKRGTIKLNAEEELKSIIKAEKIRMETAEERKSLEHAIIKTKYDIIKEEWKLLEGQAKQEEVKHLRWLKEQNRSMAATNKKTPGSVDPKAWQRLKDEIGLIEGGIEFEARFGFDIKAFEDAAKAEREILDQEFKNIADNYLVSLLGVLEKMKAKGGTDLVSPMGGTAMMSLNRNTGTRDFIAEAKAKQGSLAESMQPDQSELRALMLKYNESAGGVSIGEATDEDVKRWTELKVNIKKATTAKEAWKKAQGAAEVQLFTNAIRDFSAAVASLGEQGMLAATMADFSANLIENFAAIQESGAGTAEALALVAGAIGGISSILAASSDLRIANIDKEIAAENKRDGKSKASLAKVKSMEAKKEKMKKKAFETNKKMMIAQAIVSTAAAYVGAVQVAAAGAPAAGVAAPALFEALLASLGGMVLALGAAQIAVIASTSYQGGGGISGGAGAPASISVGARNNKVDVSQQASAGELAYLRGEKGTGTSANKFQAQGGAAGLTKGYADGGEVLVGERGPETITPLTGFNVIPNDMGSKSQINANFTIHAIDAAGVEEVLLGQQGNIIRMIRSAANDYGTNFLEEIDTDTYGDFSSAGGIDY